MKGGDGNSPSLGSSLYNLARSPKKRRTQHLNLTDAGEFFFLSYIKGHMYSWTLCGDEAVASVSTDKEHVYGGDFLRLVSTCYST